MSNLKKKKKLLNIIPETTIRLMMILCTDAS